VIALAGLVPHAAPAATDHGGRLPGAHRLALGMAHTCLLGTDGGVWCWGNGFTARAPVDLGPGRRAAAIAAGDFHTCAIIAPGSADAGAVRCWGENRAGQLGVGTTRRVGDDRHPEAAPAVDLGPGATARALAAGSNFTCAILGGAQDGAVRCWGGNSSGQLGLGNTAAVGDDEPVASVPPVDLGGHRATAIAAGGFHACAVLDDGALQCWGGNGTGELGRGNDANVGDADSPGTHPPIRVGTGRTVTGIAAGLSTTCAILDTGGVRCWGYGGSGALGLGNDESVGDDETPASVPPVALGAGRRAVGLALGAYHSCALLDDGSVRCWGPNGRGELGYGNTIPIGDAATPDQADPVKLDGRAVELAAGGYHTCVLLDRGTLQCWGPDDIGRLVLPQAARAPGGPTAGGSATAPDH
jgi:alpha-tubulin suppressor-like RCC1 family protein